MKKFLTALIILLVGCTQSPQEVEAAFGLKYIQSGHFPVKGFTDEITSTIPTAVSISLTNTSTNTAYDAVTGTPITLPVGSYNVTGGSSPLSVQKLYGSTKYTSHTPSIVVDDNVSIVFGTSAYSVGATYNSFAIGVIPSEVASWQIKVKDGSMQNVDYITGDNLHWIFITGSYSTSTPVVMTVAPPGNVAEGFNFVTDAPEANQIQAEYGKWYIIHPAGAANQSGTFSLDLPIWVEGN